MTFNHCELEINFEILLFRLSLSKLFFRLPLSQYQARTLRARLKRDGTCAETRFGLSAKRTSPFKTAGLQFIRLRAAEVCASAVVMVVMLDTPCSEVECKTTGHPIHSHVSRSLPLPCVTVCHQVSTELYQYKQSSYRSGQALRVPGG